MTHLVSCYIITAYYLSTFINFLNTYHTLEEKIHKNSQSRGLKWPKVSKKKKKKGREEFTGIEGFN